MEGKNFSKLENMCQFNYSQSGNFFHICSRENHPVLFHNENEFKIAMNVVAFCAFQFKDVTIYTFEIMDNHFHFVVGGDSDRVSQYMSTLKNKFVSFPTFSSSKSDFSTLSFKVIPVENLNNLRNVISYVNRNGFVVNADFSPFTYPWGANKYFFNDDAKRRFSEIGKVATYSQKRELFHSNLLAKNNKVILLDGYVSPACYCRISEAESFFRTCRHYFQHISKSVESTREIAKTIGESICYSDEDLFNLVGMLSSVKFGKKSSRLLSRDEKIDLAKTLHYDYNAGNKQICRILCLDILLLNQIFPPSDD